MRPSGWFPSEQFGFETPSLKLANCAHVFLIKDRKPHLQLRRKYIVLEKRQRWRHFLKKSWLVLLSTTRADVFFLTWLFPGRLKDSRSASAKAWVCAETPRSVKRGQSSCFLLCVTKSFVVVANLRAFLCYNSFLSYVGSWASEGGQGGIWSPGFWNLTCFFKICRKKSFFFSVPSGSNEIWPVLASLWKLLLVTPGKTIISPLGKSLPAPVL